MYIYMYTYAYTCMWLKYICNANFVNKQETIKMD
jgi:hypothetical protein